MKEFSPLTLLVTTLKQRWSVSVHIHCIRQYQNILSELNVGLAGAQQ